MLGQKVQNFFRLLGLAVDFESCIEKDLGSIYLRACSD